MTTSDGQYITEAELREWWQNGRGSLPDFSEGTRFSLAARDFLAAHNLTPTFTAATANLQSPISNLQLQSSSLSAQLTTLHAALLLAAAHARRFRLPELAARLNALAETCRTLDRATDNTQGATSAQTAEAPPNTDAHEMQLWLYFARAKAREAEALARTAQPGLAPALDRLARAVYDLEQGFISGALAWKPPGET